NIPAPGHRLCWRTALPRSTVCRRAEDLRWPGASPGGPPLPLGRRAPAGRGSSADALRSPRKRVRSAFRRPATRRPRRRCRWGRPGFEAGGDIDSVAKDVAILGNDVTDIDADAEIDAAFRR